MKYNILLIYFLIWLSSFVLSKDIIGSEGIPSHWKRYQKPVNNHNYHKSHYLTNKILNNKLNYETNLQSLSKITSPKDISFYKMTQPILNNCLHKKIPSNIKIDLRSSDSDKDSDRQNDENNKAARIVNEKTKEVDKRAMAKIGDQTRKNANVENIFKTPDNVRRVDTDQKSMDILHERQQIPLRQTRQMDSSSYPEKRELRDIKIEKNVDVEELQENKKNTKRSDIDKSKPLEEENGNEKSVDDELEDKEQIVESGRRNNNERSNDIGNIRPMILNPFHDPRGWVRYRFMPNQFALSNRNYINQLYPYTKDNIPFYKLQA